MDRAFSSSRGSGVMLFDEDFDLPPPSSEPEVIEPVYTAAELCAAREEAARESRDIALAEAETSARMMASQALMAISARLAAACEEAATAAEQSSEAIARLVLGCFAAAFPALSARHGQREVAALLREILPTLHREPKIVVRVSPHVATALTEEINSMDADLAARVRLIPTDAMTSGDARVTWENGGALRDTSSLWQQIESVLAPAGLLNPTDPAHPEQTVKEHELVE